MSDDCLEPAALAVQSLSRAAAPHNAHPAIDEITNVHMAMLRDDSYDERMSAFLAQRSGEDV